MIAPHNIETCADSTRKGLYESFYFRGNSEDGSYSFWLKHNLLLYKGSDEVVIESIFIDFDKASDNAKTYKLIEAVPLAKFLELKKECAGDWKKFNFTFNNGSFYKISDKKLEGEITTDSGKVSWNLDVNYDGGTYYHFSKDWFYTGFFPKKKILTNAIFMHFNGQVNIEGRTVNNKFIGMNGHNWGTEHAYKYSYANCNQFKEDSSAYFDGFSAKIVLGKVIKSPFLSGCSVKAHGNWYHFNDVLSSFKPDVLDLEQKSWKAIFKSSDCEMSVKIDGNKKQWGHLVYDHPSRKKSLVHNTKFAKGEIQIKFFDGRDPIFLNSDNFELETLIPEITPD